MDHNFKVAKRLAKIIGPRTPIPPDMRELFVSPPQGPRKHAAILCDMAKRLAAMDEYEHRALGRRRRAIRAFDAALLREREQTKSAAKCGNEATGHR